MHEENQSSSYSSRENLPRQVGEKQFNHSKSEHKAVLEASISKLWQEVLGLPTVGLEDNFFEMGGTSLIATVLLTRLNQALNLSLSIATVFEYPTVRTMAEFLSPKGSPGGEETSPTIQHRPTGKSNTSAVAIIGMTGRFPGADSVEDFWANLCDGVESISFFDREELDSQERLTGLPPNYVAARPILKNTPMFDADFFGVYPKEAEQMDPQHRVFLECAWEVLERAGYDPAHTKDAVGVFAGCSMNTYFMHNLATDRSFLENFTGGYQVGSYVTMLGNDKDFLPTRVSYKLNLRGPSINVQTACSTSLVAVCQACQSLFTHGCDMALAGAVSITFPERRGYIPQEGGIVSEDGHCRPFDHRATGTVFGSGAAILLLKRLDDAIADGDQVLAVIRGFALNNDGSNKVGYTAPSVEGQAQVILRAQQMAGITADSISYIEAHGTATPLGDPIEVAALAKAFSKSTHARQFCSIGTAKANVGHLDVAAGATGLIKAVLQIENRTIPKLLHFEKPNPHLDLNHTPFTVAQATQPWKTDDLLLRAGVSAFGMGGTNAHVIVEEAPPLTPSDCGRAHQLFLWSAKTPTALTAMTSDLEHFFTAQPNVNLADAAYTLQIGRSCHKYRCGFVAGSTAEASEAVKKQSADILREDKLLENPSIVFCFPGQGVQTANMGRKLYESELVFRQAMDECNAILRPLLGENLLDLLYSSEAKTDAAARLNETAYAQPAIFALEYALAQLWLSWGIRPDAMVGHSVGEYVAMCIAGVFSLEDALRLIAVRGRLMQKMPRGSMLSVRASQEKVVTLMGDDLDLAAVNGPQLCVVSGPDDAIAAFAAKLDAQGIVHRKLATSHAFHSRMVDSALAPFAEFVRGISFGSPMIPCVSTLTGTWITGQEVAQPEYWTRQLRSTVRFADAVRELARTPERIFLEVGPAETLVQLIRQTINEKSAAKANTHIALASLPSVREGVSEDKAILNALGRLWLAGTNPDWSRFHAGYIRKRLLLPTYPFERKKFWVAPPQKETIEKVQVPPTLTLPPTTHAVTAPLKEEQRPMTTLVANRSTMLNELQLLITDLSGIELANADPESSFLELGFDSLFLTQLTQAIQGKYRLKLTFRQIMESYPTLSSLTAHLEANVAPELRAPAAGETVSSTPTPTATAVPAPVAAIAPVLAQATVPPSAPTGSIEALFTAQMQALSGLFQQQLAMLSVSQGTSAAAAPSLPSNTQQVVPAQPLTPTVAAPVVTSTSSAPIDSKPAKPVFTPFKPLQRGEDNKLNAVQEKYLNEFIHNYNQRSSRSKKFTQEHRKVFADGRVVSGFNAQIKDLIYPLVVDRAKGSSLWDKDGNRYVDILNGYGAILFGHSPDFLVDAVHKQLDLGFAIGPQTELAGECAELVRDLTGMERVTFCNTGSEAVMGAMRLARTVTGRNLVVLFSGDYHGSFDEVLVKAVGGHRSMPVAPGIPRESVANILVLDYGTPESLETIRQRAHELAAVLVEPVQSRHPDLRPAEFLKEVRRITEQNGTALIFDEVVTGFRTHPGGMQAVYGVRADLATYGKVVAGGLPVGVLAGSSAFMDALDGGMWQYGDQSFPEAGVTFYAGTFMRHPLALAGVRACLQHIKEEGPGLQERLAAKTASLAHDIQRMLHDFSHPSSIETYSSWFYLPVATDPFLTRMLHFHLREQGVHVQEGFPCFLTTAHTDADFDFVREAFQNSLRAMRAGQALPQPKDTSSPAEQPAATFAPLETAVRTIPITEPQREILLGTQLGDEANCSFNESTSLTLKGKLNEQALISGLEQLVQRHDSLRLTFDMENEAALVAPSLSIEIEHHDLSQISDSERAAQSQALIEEEGSTPFDLVNGPLFRIHLVRLASDEHVVIFTAHHIIFDGWSTNVFFNELSDLYNAAVSGRKTSLPTPLTFTQYAIDQREQAASDDRRTTESFWMEQFNTIPSPLQIPTDRPRSSVRSHEGATNRYVFDSELFQAVRKAGARQGSTLFATLLAAFAQLVHRLSEQDDVVIGIPMAGQSKLDNGSTLVGHCVNFLPIRSRLLADQTLVDFLKQTRKMLLDAYDHQDYTYGTLLHNLKLTRDPSRLGLIEIQANVEQVGADLSFDGLSADLRSNGKKHANMDLFFNFIDRGTELWLECDYNAGLFDSATIDRWFGHLNSILQAFAQNLTQPCTSVSLLTPEQQQEILVDWNQTATQYPRSTSIHRIFERQAAETPDSTALVAGEHELTYAEINEKANQLAHYLTRSGIRVGSRVALCADRSAEVIVSLLAILKTGAAYVPIDPSYPAQRLSYLINDSAAKILLTRSTIAAKLPQVDINVVLLDHEWPTIALEETANLSHEGHAEDLAYVMYTSGSTGNPKGVLVPHRAIARLVKNNPFASFGADEVFLQLAPLSFDAATFEIWGALLNGGRLVLATGERITPEDIGRHIKEHGVTTLWLTAALFHLIATEHIDTLRPLRQLLAGGDVLSLTHVRRICEQLPHLKLINGYGPTENTTFTCCHPITLESIAAGTVPIGRPVANTRIYILDSNMRPVPPGVTGELYAAGDGLALGYLNAPELTAAKFMDHIFANGRSERLYRSGDLARYRADSTVEFLGRIDTQVKIRGYRIELAEIEYALEQSPKVRSAVVAVRTDWVTPNDTPGDKRLVAYVIPEQPGDNIALTQELRQYLQERLPDYMRPAAIMVLESFPRTVNGKIDRRALPAPIPEQLLRKRAVVYPRNQNEEILAGIWAKVLGLKEISVEDSIFELGGDSLLIFRITTLTNQAGLRVNARHFFQHRTIAGICSQLEEASAASTKANSVAPIKAIPRSQHRQKLQTLK
jgi:amino acid adenylation domain-containing protein